MTGWYEIPHLLARNFIKPGLDDGPDGVEDPRSIDDEYLGKCFGVVPLRHLGKAAIVNLLKQRQCKHWGISLVLQKRIKCILQRHNLRMVGRPWYPLEALYIIIIVHLRHVVDSDGM
jgi:hypothetical protein